MLPRLFLLCSIVLLTSSLQGQSPNLKGMWVGTLTQNEGGYRNQYSFEIYVKEDGAVVTGRTYVSTAGIYGELSFTGQRIAGVLHLRELELVYSRKPTDLAWCFKTMQLEPVRRNGVWYLEGPWQGTSDFGTCIPGWIVLKRPIPRV